MNTDSSDLEFVSSRVLNAPPSLVFEAYSDPAQLAQWWGPNGFTNTFHEFEFRPGGNWRFAMHGPDGTDYKNESVFREVVPAERIVLDHVTGPRFRMTHTFEDLGGRTRLTWRMRFETQSAYDSVKGFVPECNEQNFDRLGSLLESLQATH